MSNSFLTGFSYADNSSDSASFANAPDALDGFSYAGGGSTVSAAEEYQNTIKRAGIVNKGGPSNMEEFSFLNPNATKDDKTAFASQIAEKALATREARNEERLNKLAGSERSAGEFLGDSALSLLGKGSIGVGEAAYGAADLLSRANPARFLINEGGRLAEEAGLIDKAARIPSLDEATGGFSQNFAESREILDSFQSEKIQANRELTNRRMSKLEERAQEQTKELVKDGWDPTLAAMYQQSLNLDDAALDYLSNPTMLFDEVLASAPQSLLGSATGSLAVKAAAKNAAAKGLSKEATKKATEKAGELAGVATTAASEGLSNAVSVQGEILARYEDESTAPELMKSSKEYRALIEDGMSHKEAVRSLADTAFNTTGLIAGAISGGISKATGAGSFIGNLTNEATSGTGNILKRIATKGAEGAYKESIEEAVQSGGGQFATNVAKKTTVDNEQSLTEGTGTAAGIGAAVGGAQSGAIGAAKGIQRTTEQKREDAAKAEARRIEHEKVLNGTKAVKTAADELVKGLNGENPSTVNKFVMDPTHALYDPEIALAVETHADFKESSPENIAKHQEALIESVTNAVSNETLEPNELKTVSRNIDVVTDTLGTEPVNEDVEYTGTPIEKFAAAVENNDKVNASQFGLMVKREVLNARVETLKNESVDTESAPESIKTEVEALGEENDASTAPGLSKLLRVITQGLNKEDADPAEVKKLLFYGKTRIGFVNSQIEGINEQIDEEVTRYEATSDKDQKKKVGELIKLMRKERDAYVEVAGKYEALIEEKGKDVSISKEDIAAIASKYSSPQALTEELMNTPENLSAAQAEVTSAIDQLELDSTQVSDKDLENLSKSAIALQVAPQAMAKLKIEMALRKHNTTLRDVGRDIKLGGVSANGKTFKGIKQYFDSVRTALNSSKTSTVARQMELFNKFRAGKEVRARAFEKAYKEAVRTGKEVPVEGQFREDRKTLNTVTAGSGALVKAAVAESKALNQSYKELNDIISGYKNDLAKKGLDVADDTTPEKTKTTLPEEKTEVAQEETTAVDDSVFELDVEETTAETNTIPDEAFELDSTPDDSQPPLDAYNDIDTSSEESENNIPDDLFELEGETETSAKSETTEEEATAPVVETPSLLPRLQEAPEAEKSNNFFKRSPSKYSKADQEFLLSNPVIKYFTQKVTTVLGGFPDAIAAISKMNNASIKALFNKEDTSVPTNADVAMVKGFVKFGNLFKNTLKRRYPNNRVKESAFRHERPIHYLLEEGGVLPSELINALAIAGFEWAATRGPDTQYQTYRSVGAFLGGIKEDEVTAEQFNKFKDIIGQRDEDVIKALGQIAYKQLGLKQGAKGGSNLEDNLITSLGLEVVNTLIDMKVVRKVDVPLTEILKADGESTAYMLGKDENGVEGLYENNRGKQGKKVTERFITSIRLNETEFAARPSDLQSDASRLFSELAGTARDGAMASINKPAGGQVSNKVRNSDGQVAPKVMHDNAKKDANTAYYLNVNMNRIVNTLRESSLVRLLGGGTVESNIESEQDSVEGRNTGIEANIKRLNKFKRRLLAVAQGMAEKSGQLPDISTLPIYFPVFFGKQMRQTISTSDLNPSLYKLDRYLVNTPEVEVKLDDEHKMTLFAFAVTQGLGVKTDKIELTETVKAFYKLLSDPVFAAGVEAAEVSIGGAKGLTVEQENALIAAVEQGGEGVISLKAIMSLAEYKIAKETSGVESFKTSVTYEIDGLTNGPANAILQFGIGGLTSEVMTQLNKAGFMTDTSYASYQEFASDPNNLDIYQGTAVPAYSLLQDIAKDKLADKKVSARNKTQIKALLRYLGELRDEKGNIRSMWRNLLKNPITVRFYGSGEKSISKKVVQYFFDEFSATANKYHKMTPEQFAASQKEYAEFVRTWGEMTNTFVPKGKLPKPADLKFDEQAFNNLRYLIDTTIGSAINEAINNEFAETLKVTTQVTAAGNVIFSIFNHLYEEAVTKARKAAIAAGELSKYEDLPASVYAEIKKSLIDTAPIFKTMFSADASEGIFVAGVNKSTGGGHDATVEQRIKDQKMVVSGSGKTTTGIGSVRSPEKGFTAPGASPMSMLVQGNGDAATMGQTGGQGLNVYDARILGLDGVEQTGHNLNKAQLEAGTFNLLNEVLDVFTRTMEKAPSLGKLSTRNFNELFDTLSRYAEVPQDVREGLTRAEKLEMAREILSVLGEDLNEATTAVNEAKTKLFSGDMKVTQFVSMVPGVSITDGTVNEGQSKAYTKAQLKSKMKEAVSEMAEEIVEVISEPEPVSASDSIPLNETIWRQSKKKSSPVNEALGQGLVDGTRASTFGELLDTVISKTESPFYKLLAGQLKKLLPANGAVILFDQSSSLASSTYMSGGKEFSIGTALGIADVGGEVFGDGKSRLFLDVSPNGATTETVLHELVHMVTVNALNQYAANPSSLPVFQRKAIERILALRDEMLKLGPDAIKEMKIEYGLNSSDSSGVEFVAMGMTNAATIAALENTGVAAQVNRLIKEMFSAIQSFLGLKPDTTNAFNELVYNVSIIANWSSKQGFINNPSPTSVLSIPPAPMIKVEERVESMSSEDMFESLESSSEKETARLRPIFKRLHEKFLKGLTGSDAINRSTMSNDDHLLLDRLDPEIEDSTSHLLSNGFSMSPQAAFVFKTHMLAYKSLINDFNFSSKEILREYLNAKSKLSPKDFMLNPNAAVGSAAYADDLLVAEHKYEAMFGSNRPDDFLSAFLAMSQVDDGFRSLLSGISTAKVTKKDVLQRDLLKTLQLLVDGLINAFNTLASSGRYAANTQVKVDTLLKNIQHIERVAGSRIIRSVAKGAQYTGEGFTKANNALRSKLSTVLNSEAARKTGNFFGKTFVNTSLQVTRKAALTFLNEDRARATLEAIEEMQDGITSGKQSVAGSVYDEFTGGRKNKRPIHRLLGIKNSLIGQARSRAEYAIKETIKNGFLDAITEEQDHALKLVMNADLSALYAEGYTVREIADLLGDDKLLASQIATVTANLKNSLPAQHSLKADMAYMTENIEALGILMVHNRAVKQGVMTNAKLIAMRATNPKYVASEAELVAITPIIDELASLYAMKHAPESSKKELYALMDKEVKRTDGVASATNNGMTGAFAVHNIAKKNALLKAFQGDELQVMKGYSKDTYDPFTAVKYGKRSDAKEMRRRGYNIGPKMPPVPGEKDLDLYMYISTDGGDAGYQQSVLSLTDMVMQGTAKNLYGGAGALPSTSDSKTISRYGRKLAALPTTGTLKDLGSSHLLPVYNSEGQITGLRMIVPNMYKDRYMGRKNAFLEDIARTVSHTEEKVNTQTINKMLVDGMIQVYEDDKKNKRMKGYVYVSADSADPRLREIYHIMPEQARQDFTAAFGNKFPIRKDLVDVAFGYREPSVAELFANPEDAHKGVRKLIVDMVTTLFGKEVGYYIRKGETGLQELVKLSKDVTVIRSVVVLAGNIISNNTELVVNQGMNPLTAARMQWKGFTAARSYQNTQKELSVLKLQAAASTDRADKRRMNIKIEELTNTLARNPITPLVQAGLMSSIVEGEEVGEYSFNPNGLLGKADSVFQAVPDVITTPLKYALMSKGTPMYEFLHTSTMLSDFASRYALYDHSLKQGMEPQAAIDLITDTFINYDVPVHRMLQWADSVGMTRFLKYYMRIQRVIARAFREHPGRLLMFALAQNWIGVDVASPMDSFVLTNDLTNKLGTLDNVISGFESHGIFQL